MKKNNDELIEHFELISNCNPNKEKKRLFDFQSAALMGTEIGLKKERKEDKKREIKREKERKRERKRRKDRRLALTNVEWRSVRSSRSYASRWKLALSLEGKPYSIQF